ncbi:peptidoglycan-recognition protein LC-like [Neocloeon triangulifer]|uniref:peptidoglycan-recognition protein LC-like n=1 Tax=Neocloeon triangulifer TaxID=2078957 RepID=UPI00286F4333|nr:peptidoglycan-recognition protein LC-like [Neocloeon triangulifer]
MSSETNFAVNRTGFINSALAEESSSEDSSEEEDGQTVNIQVPSTHFSNVQVKHSSNVHFGNSAVYNGDVTVIMSPIELSRADTSLQQLKGVAEKTVLVSSGLPNNLDDDSKSKLAAVEQILGRVRQSQDQVTSNTKRNQRSTLCFKFTLRRLIAFISMLTVIVGLIIALVLIWNLKGSQSKIYESEYQCPEYDKESNVINGTEGSAPYYSRIDWLAQPVDVSDPLHHPVEFVIISHSATNPCYNHTQCVLQVRKIQMFHIESFGWADIGYNFVVGGEGGIYEGRGWDKIGAHAKGYNNRSIGVNFIGTYVTVLPSERQMMAAKILIEEGVRLGKVSPEYKLIAHRQVSKTESPGIRFFLELQSWPHWAAFYDLPKFPP